MPDIISRIRLGQTPYDIRDAQAARASDLALKQDALTAGNGIAIDSSDIIRTTGIPFGTCDSTSTSKVFTATVPGIYKLEDGVCCIIKNGVVTSESGFTLNVNGLGAKPSYSNMATGNPITPTSPTRDTTIFNINYAMLFIYTTSLPEVPNGAWICYRGYDANTNTIGYQVRSNSQSLPASQKFYRYRLLFTSADGTHYVPANTSSSTNATSSRTVNQTPIDPFGPITYYGTTAAVEANARPAAASLWIIYTLNLGYSFNRTGAALTLTSWAPVYVKCAPQSNGSAIIDADNPYVQALPTTNDGKIYIFLGIAYSATNIELLNNHPVYYHDGTGIKLWIGEAIPSQSDIDAAKPLIVNATAHYDANDIFTGYSLDKTSEQISNAFSNGRNVILIEDEDLVYHLNHCYDDGDSERNILFQRIRQGNNENTAYYISIENFYDDNDIVTVDERNLDKLYQEQYVNVKNLRNNSKLVPGAWYRITDYTCTTTQTDTQSAGHQFDILVQATSPNTLSEEAKAIRHEGDTYFANSNLEAWKIWYCLDNDTTRFAWADATNGKGVIYRMIDEWGNDCPYDFKNIQFKRDLTDGVLDTENGTTTWVYTFNLWHTAQELYFDASIIGNTLKNDEGFVNGVYNNKMGVVNSYTLYYGSGSGKTNFVLPNNVFLTKGEDLDYYGCYSNKFGNDCYSNTFGDSCSSNTFGDNCSSNTFGNDCYHNTFGNNCYHNTFGNGCYSNTFGNYCSINTFGNNCYFNTFGDNFNTNTFGNDCYHNTFGNDCYYNKFGNYCYHNTFGNNCYFNTFGNYCSINTFGNNCYFNTFSKPYTQNVIIENGNSKINLTSSQTPISSNSLRNITIAQGVNNTDTTKTISHNTLNDTFRTTYVAANSVEVQV